MEAAYEAAWEGDLRGVEVALAAGTDVNQIMDDGGTMLKTAAEEGHHEVVRFLLEHGADPDLGVLGPFDSRPLHLADAEIIDLLVAHGANVELRDHAGRTALMEHAGSLNVDEVHALLRHGGSFNDRDTDDRTALDLARRSSQRIFRPPNFERDRSRRYRGQQIIDLLEAVEAAGSWKRYKREPIVQLLSLRYLCLAGRAMAPPKLVRCFGAPPVPNAGKARTRSRRAANTPLPDEVFSHILGFWSYKKRF
jgi:hypothetical protein